ncbi:MAG: DUF222 domain-containing protein, partial [Leifsonia sp.]
ARLSLLGESLPARYPDLAEALAVTSASSEPDDDGVARSVLSVDQVAVIVRELDKATANCSPDAVAQGERLLVEHAQGLTVEDLRILAAQVRDRLDQDGILPREERQRRRRSLTISTTTDGMTHVDWYLDPESAGYVVTAIDALVGRQLRKVAFREVVLDGAADDGDGVGVAADGDDRAMPESRSLPQIRSDSATDAFRHLAACTAAAESGTPPVSVIVRIELDALRKGLGTAQIDGIPTPISAATARRMAADAHLIPVVLGEASEVLDLGRSRRLFSRAQKLALAERDGGCAWTGCPHPPSYTEAHHIRWWTAHGGTTDLDNGILLCSSHHHRVHADGWNIEIRDHVPWFIPPLHVDPYRRPRRGGRIVYPAEQAAPMSRAS